MADEVVSEASAAEVVTAHAPVNEGATQDAPVSDAPDWGTRITEWGGEDSIAEAVDFARSMQTVEGVKFFLGEGAKALRDLGIPADELAKLVAAEAAAATDDSTADFDPNAPLTMAQYEALEQKRNEKAAQERTEAEFRVSVENNVKSGLAAIGVTDQKVGQIVAQYADQYVTPVDYGNPAKIAAALKRGYEDFQTIVREQHEAYLGDKAGDAASSPTPLVGGQTPGGVELPEPQTLEEAIARRKKMWADQGVK